MARLISRKPFVGIVAGLLFGALGILLLGIESDRAASGVLFSVSAWFFLGIGILSVSAGAYAFVVHLRDRKVP